MYRFKSKADGDLLMLAPVGDQILRLIGKEPAAQGIVEHAALPEAIAALEVAIAAEAAQRGGLASAHGRDDDEAGAVGIGLQQRAWPMLEMMRRSLGEGADIVWGV